MKPTRRNLMTGGAALAASLAASRLRAEPVLTDDGLYRQPWFVESFLELGDDLQAAANLRQALRRHVGIARLPLLPRDASGQFRAPGYRGLRQGEFRHPAAQHHRRAQGDGFRRQRNFREGARGEIRRPLHADAPVLPRERGQPFEQRRRTSARSRARPAICGPTISSRCSATCARRDTSRRVFGIM